MLASDSEAAFTEYAKARDHAISDLDAAAAVATMTGFYRDIRAERTRLDADGDALLFQWGTYGFNGEPDTFQFNLTRQFIENQIDDEQGEMSQFHLTLHFGPSGRTAGLVGNEWCWNPNDLDEFQQFIQVAEASTWASGRAPARVECYWSLV